MRPKFSQSGIRSSIEPGCFLARSAATVWFIVPFAIAIPCRSSAADVLPKVESSFKGKIAVSAKQSVPDWPQPVKASPGAPNMLLIMLDDVGFADTSTFGGLAQTPVLDRLAAEGLRYNRFHTTSACAMTRAALLTGRNHHRVGYGSFGGIGYPGYDGLWKKSTVSIAEVLKRNGYSTAAFGKWHNTPHQDISPVGPFDRWPTGLGFEYFYGNLLGVSSQWEPPLWRNTQMVPPPATPEQGYHFTTDITDEAIRWLHTHESLAPEKPYFVYFAPEAAHTPHHVPKAWIERYRGQFDRGWDKVREDIFKRQKKLGVIPADAALTPRPKEMPAWNSLSTSQRRFFARQMEAYAAFIAHADFEIGRLIQTIKEGSHADNTLILFIVGDNGAGGTADPSADPIQDSAKRIDEIGSVLSPLTDRHVADYAWPWGWMGNTPFRQGKGVASHFGGTRNPLVVSWPARVKDGGGLRSQFAHVNDIAATVYEAASVELPTVVDAVEQSPLDGVSLIETFGRADAPDSHRVQYFEGGGSRAIYRDGWMASALPSARESSSTHDFGRDRWELYHVAEDFSQAHDVATRYPQKLDELKALFDTEARRNGIYPLGAGRLTRSPEWFEGKRTFVFYPDFPTTFGFPGLSTAADNRTWDFSQVHRITADVVIPQSGASGTILAWGGRYGGVAFYAKDNRLVFENNVAGRAREVIISNEPLPVGESELTFELDTLGLETARETIGRLYIDRRLVNEKKLSPNTVYFYDGVFEIGENSVSPISRAYGLPFKFNGTLKQVRVDLR